MMGLNLHTWKSGKINLTTTPLQYWGHYSIKVAYYTLLVTFLISTATGISSTLLNYSLAKVIGYTSHDFTFTLVPNML